MVLDLLRKRFSARKFLSKNISNEILSSILEASRLSPSGGNEQSWKFGVITDTEIISKISELAYNQKWIKSSALLIILCTKIVEDERGGRDIQKARFGEYGEDIENMDKMLYSSINLEEHQTKIPGTNMVLQALEYGIQGTWISYFKVKKVAELLGLPPTIIPSEIIAFGYPAITHNMREKKDIEDIVFYNKYN